MHICSYLYGYSAVCLNSSQILEGSTIPLDIKLRQHIAS